MADPQKTDQTPLWRRLSLFFVVPALAAVSPLLVLPVVARSAGPAGWASAIAGESIGTVASILIGFGWMAIGPALISMATDDRHRGELYRGSLIVRSLLAIIALPALCVICWVVAAPGKELLAMLMGVQGALIALTFTWFSAGVGRPGAIIVYDSIPRLGMAVLCAVAISNGAPVELYPAAGIIVTLVGTGLFTLGVLRQYRSPWPWGASLRSLFRSGLPVVMNDAGLTVFSSIPTPLVTVISEADAAAGFASADKMLKLGQFIPVTLANALQTWISEVRGASRRRRIAWALTAHGGIGVLGGIVLAAAGAWVSRTLFGEQAEASGGVLAALGLTFAFFSIRTSMTRHVLYPAGRTRAVFQATLIASVLGIPVMIALALWVGPVGAAIGYAATEGMATLFLWRVAVQSVRDLTAVTEPGSDGA